MGGGSQVGHVEDTQYAPSWHRGWSPFTIFKLRDILYLNIQVKFLMRGYKGPDYKALSEDTVLHQVGVNFFLSVALFSPSWSFCHIY